MRERRDQTHDKGLVEFGAEQALLPVVTHGAPHGFGDGLLDAVRDPRLIVEELWVLVDAISTRRREAHRRERRRRTGGRGWCRGRCDGELPMYTGRRLGAPDGAVLVVRSPGGSSRGRGRGRRRMAGCRGGAQRNGRRGQRRRVVRRVAGGPQARAGAKAVDGRRRRRGRACHGGRDGRCRCRGCFGK